ncbi:MAG: 3-hydroxybutyryl-CoA dehydrogenase [Holosporales bacterium]|nr:3-hydroxybutyryl-CoA dehydrogenase [Holosporales bacterium]
MTNFPRKVGVIGAGRMGLGITQLFLEHEVRVVLHDSSSFLLNKAERKLKERCLRAETLSEKASSDNILKKLTLSDRLQDFSVCDFIIEAIFESYEAKEGVFDNLKEYISGEAILATNTSSLSVTRLAHSVPNPRHFLGFHFMNPAHRIPLVELIRAPETDDDVFRKSQDLAGFLGKTVILSRDTPAFILNRVLVSMINEAICVLEERIARVEDIDKAFVLGAQHPIGPLSLADFIGLDIVLAILKTLYTERGEKYRPSALLKDYVARGWLGRKSGRGFFMYDEGGYYPFPPIIKG